MDWAQKPSIASYFLRTGMGGVPITGYNSSPEVRDGVKLKTDVGVSSLQNLMQLYASISEEYRARSNPKKAVATLRRAMTEVDLRAAEAPAPGADQKKGVHPAEDAILGKAKLHLQLCATFSRQGQHFDALNEAQKCLEEIDEMWKLIRKTSEIDVEEITLIDLFLNPLHVEAMLRSYNLQWLEEAVCVTIQAKHCVAIELEFEIDSSAPEEEKAKAWEKIIALHEEGANLAKEVLLPQQATRRLAETTLSQAQGRRAMEVSEPTGVVDDRFCIPQGDEIVQETGKPAGAAGDAERVGNAGSQQLSRQAHSKMRESSGSPKEASGRRRRPARGSPRNKLARSATSASGKNPFQDFFDDECDSLETMRKHLLVRDESCVREFHGELKRRQSRFREWMAWSDPDDLFEFRTTFSEAGLRCMRRQEKKKAMSEGRPVLDDIDPKSHLKTVKGIKKNLLTSNTALCKKAGVEQEDPNAAKTQMLTGLAISLRGDEPRQSRSGSKSMPAAAKLGGKFAAFAMNRQKRPSKDPFQAF